MNLCHASTVWIVWKASLLTGVGLVVAMKPLVATLRPKLYFLEIASTPEQVAKIIWRWAKKERRNALWATLIDFVFAVSYAAFLGSTCVLFSIRHLPIPALLANAGWVAAIFALIAGICDWVENTGMCLELWRARKKRKATAPATAKPSRIRKAISRVKAAASPITWRLIARLKAAASWIKWILVGLVLLYILIVGLWLELAWLVSLAVAAFNNVTHLFRLMIARLAGSLC